MMGCDQGCGMGWVGGGWVIRGVVWDGSRV